MMHPYLAELLAREREQDIRRALTVPRRPRFGGHRRLAWLVMNLREARGHLGARSRGDTGSDAECSPSRHATMS